MADALIETAKLCGVDPEAWLGRCARPHPLPQDHQVGRADALASLGMSVVRLHVALEDVEPAVTRRMEVPTSLRLDRLHLVLQAAMPWRNHHLHELEAAGRRWGLPDPDYGPDHGCDETSPAAKATLADTLAAAGDAPMGHLHDFGNGWRHAIAIEATLPPDPSHLYPRLTEVAGAHPRTSARPRASPVPRPRPGLPRAAEEAGHGRRSGAPAGLRSPSAGA